MSFFCYHLQAITYSLFTPSGSYKCFTYSSVRSRSSAISAIVLLFFSHLVISSLSRFCSPSNHQSLIRKIASPNYCNTTNCYVLRTPAILSDIRISRSLRLYVFCNTAEPHSQNRLFEAFLLLMMAARHIDL